MSLCQATKVGCEVRMKDDALMLYDKTGALMVKTTRSKNRLYKVTLQADTIQCLLTSAPTESSKWHARLGHVAIETMKMMINKELVVGITHITIERKKHVFHAYLENKRDNLSLKQLCSERCIHLSLYTETYADLYHLPRQVRNAMCLS